ncbi:ribosomal RNA processing protein 36 [Acrasis kona]|uniref:rRNA biogenesis protein RRP36 n=1 Tax=Acrasis kona TaxID=1008807 RepID=A0AAW2ZK37_9EUKA
MSDSEGEFDTAELSFEDRLRAKQNETIRNLNLKEKKAAKDASALKQQKSTLIANKADEAAELHKKNKNAPKEVSSKAYVPRIRNVTKQYQIKKIESRDPRFMAATAGKTPDAEVDGYDFIKDMRKEELGEFQERLKNKDLSYEERAEIKRNVSKLNGAIHRTEQAEMAKKIRTEFYEKEKKLVAEQGKTPYFLKDSDVKKIMKKRKIEELKESGGLDKYLEKKRKKQKSSQTSLMPTTRRSK